MTEGESIERGKVLHSRPCFPRYLGQNSAWVNSLLIGWSLSEEKVASKISKLPPSTAAHL